MELLKNKLCFIIKKIGSSKWSLLIIVLSLSFVILHRYSNHQREEVIEVRGTRFSIAKDKDFLSCVYSQLECYNEKAGASRKIIIDSCGDIGACNTLK